jgi:hypothetical protein
MLEWLESWIKKSLQRLGYVPKNELDSSNYEAKLINSGNEKIIETYKDSLSKAQETIAVLTNQVSLLNSARAPVQNPNLSNVSWPRLKKILEQQDRREFREASKLVQDPRNEKTQSSHT